MSLEIRTVEAGLQRVPGARTSAQPSKKVVCLCLERTSLGMSEAVRRLYHGQRHSCKLFASKTAASLAFPLRVASIFDAVATQVKNEEELLQIAWYQVEVEVATVNLFCS